MKTVSLLLLTGGLLAGAAIEVGEKRTIASEPGKHFGFPRMVRAKDSSLLLFYRVGTTHAWDAAINVMRRSRDEGATWTAEREVSRGSDAEHGSINAVPLVTPAGRILLWVSDIFIAKPPYRRDPNYWRWSDDHGETWSPLIRFDPDPNRSTYYVTDAIPVSDGLLAGAATFPPGGVGNCYTVMWHSADGGKTWSVRSLLTKPDENRGDEVGLLETAPGEVLCLLRVRKGKGLSQFRSKDNGRTWTEGENLGEMLGCTLQRPVLTRLSRTRVLLTGRDFERRQVVAYLSEDNGRTWKGRTVIETYQKDGAYTSCVPLKDGAILMAYYSDAAGEPLKPEIKTVRLRIR